MFGRSVSISDNGSVIAVGGNNTNNVGNSTNTYDGIVSIYEYIFTHFLNVFKEFLVSLLYLSFID